MRQEIKRKEKEKSLDIKDTIYHGMSPQPPVSTPLLTGSCDLHGFRFGQSEMGPRPDSAPALPPLGTLALSRL